MVRAGAELGGISPKRFENGVRAFQRIDAKLRHAKIRGLADDSNVAEEETHVRDIDVEHRRLDIDRHIRSRHSAARNQRAEGAGACAHPAGRLPAFFVSDEGKEQSGIDFDSRTIEGADGLERHA